MAQFTITIPDKHLNKVVDALSLGLGWTSVIQDPQTGDPIDNPETKRQWARRMMQDYIKKQYRKYWGNQAVKAIDVDATRQVAIDQAVTEIENLTVE